MSKASPSAMGKLLSFPEKLYARKKITPGADPPDGKRPLRTVRSRKRRSVYSTTICDLGSDRVQLRSPLVVVLEDYGTEVIASWPEVEAWAGGTTESEAVDGLKDEIASLYAEIGAAEDESLGTLPRRWKRALRSVVVEADR